MVGVVGSIPIAPTNKIIGLRPPVAATHGLNRGRIRISGAPTAAMHMSGPIGTAIVSFATGSPRRTARVETLRHEIDRRRLHRQLEFDVGIVPREPFDGGPQEGLGGVLRRRDADGSSRLLAKLGEHRELGIDLVEGWPQALDKQFARVRRRNVAVVRVRRRARSCAPRPRRETPSGCPTARGHS